MENNSLFPPLTNPLPPPSHLGIFTIKGWWSHMCKWAFPVMTPWDGFDVTSWRTEGTAAHPLENSCILPGLACSMPSRAVEVVTGLGSCRIQPQTFTVTKRRTATLGKAVVQFQGLVHEVAQGRCPRVKIKQGLSSGELSPESVTHSPSWHLLATTRSFHLIPNKDQHSANCW